MFTLYRIVKRSVTESVPDRASVHTRNAAFEAFSALEQCWPAPLLKVERSISDRFLKRSKSSLNTFIGAEIATEPRFGDDLLKSKGSVANCMTDRACVHTGSASGLCSHWERFGTISAPQQNINSCSHCIGATFETEQKPIRYSVNIATDIPLPLITNKQEHQATTNQLQRNNQHLSLLLELKTKKVAVIFQIYYSTDSYAGLLSRKKVIWQQKFYYTVNKKRIVLLANLGPHSKFLC